ncbi:Zinc finger and SCAN domain-containing protein 10 [Toxocara canis]|uniref:Zinc finger and SCAN domain-containing protein 10 n=1 Tax=Toxocara canis TaxID=6265 RepID=A0A0B2W6P3_TOXCA|nr:Zinc finger and SCAN domain-containing protein 10 [Toxocara canis]
MDGVQAAFNNAAEAVRRLLETIQQSQQPDQHTPENIVRCIVTQLQPIVSPQVAQPPPQPSIQLPNVAGSSVTAIVSKVEIKTEPEIDVMEPETNSISEIKKESELIERHLPQAYQTSPQTTGIRAAINAVSSESAECGTKLNSTSPETPEISELNVERRTIDETTTFTQVKMERKPADAIPVEPFSLRIAEVYLPPKEPRLTPAEDTLRLKYRRFRQKQFTCEYCNHTFTLKHNMRAHIANYHSAGGKTLQPRGKRYKCLKCGWLYRTMDEVERHQRREHERRERDPPSKEWLQDINCDFCDEKFKSQNQLREHCNFVHLNLRPYECRICNMKFARKGGLNRHNLTVHSDFVYPCPYKECTHAGFKCSKALSAHIRSVHTHVRPYKCEQCGKSFVRRNDLRTHETMHSADWGFVCDTCGQKFRCSAYLKRHNRSQHGLYNNDQKQFVDGSLTAIDQKKADDSLFSTEGRKQADNSLFNTDSHVNGHFAEILNGPLASVF